MLSLKLIHVLKVMKQMAKLILWCAYNLTRHLSCSIFLVRLASWTTNMFLDRLGFLNFFLVKRTLKQELQVKETSGKRDQCPPPPPGCPPLYLRPCHILLIPPLPLHLLLIIIILLLLLLPPPSPPLRSFR